MKKQEEKKHIFGKIKNGQVELLLDLYKNLLIQKWLMLVWLNLQNILKVIML